MLRTVTTSFSPPHPASINSHHLTGNIRTRPSRQPNHDTLEIPRSPPSAHGDAFQDAPRAILIRNQRGIHIRLDISRRDSIDIDALGGPFVGERFGELRDAAFGSGVGGDGESALEREEGGDVYYAASVSVAVWGQRGGEHVCSHVTAELEDSC